MTEPIIKRFRLQNVTQQISDKALQNFARAAFENGRKEDSPNGRQDSFELKRKCRKTTMLKPTSIRPLPLKDDNLRETFNYFIVKKPLGDVVFGRNEEYKESMGQKYDCPVYEYKNRRKLTFFPIIIGDKASRRYACVDCYHVYSVMTVLRNRLDSIPVCRWEELGEDKDPLGFPHYCSHWDALTKAQKLYFKEYYWQYKHDEQRLIEYAIHIGIFVKKMCSYDIKTAKFCQENEGQDDNSLICYIQGLDYTLKEQRNAESFLECFKTLHKGEITKDDKGHIHIEGSFDSQDGVFPDSQTSQSSQGSNSSQKVRKQIYAPPSATLSSLHSMQNASSLSGSSSTQPKSSSTNDISPTEAPTNTPLEQVNLANNLADINVLQDLVSGLNSTSGSPSPNQLPELDLKQFVTGLLMSTMTTVSNAQLQVLYDGLRPLVARYAPDCLNQFIAMIHKIDRNMPNEMQAVKLNTFPNEKFQNFPQVSEATAPRIITTTTNAPQTGNMPKILRRFITKPSSGSTSTNPITIADQDEPRSRKINHPK